VGAGQVDIANQDANSTAANRNHQGRHRRNLCTVISISGHSSTRMLGTVHASATLERRIAALDTFDLST